MRKTVKIVEVNSKKYLVSADQIEIGDVAIVMVGSEFPTIVECENEMVVKLITESKLSLTKAYKVVGLPEQIDLTEDELKKLESSNWICEIDFDENSKKNKIKFLV